MNKITQTAERAKETAIERQSREMIERYEKADENERQAIIGQIDSLIPALRSDDEKCFWLDFRRRLTRSKE